MLFFLSKIRTLQWLFLFLFRSSSPSRAFRPAEPGRQSRDSQDPTPGQHFQDLPWLHGFICVWHQLCFTPQTPPENKWRSKGRKQRGCLHGTILSTLFKGALFMNFYPSKWLLCSNTLIHIFSTCSHQELQYG